ncbi:MAG: exosortase-associated EpsI family protein [Acidobacteriales bacterium]|nr:exosortase-associated EpsI family protein [Terriglobales bacterium]
MQTIPRTLIIALALLLAAAVADHYAMAWNRTLSPLQQTDMHRFPKSFAGWSGIDYQTEMIQASRNVFGTDNFIDRIYTAPNQYPVELVLVPTAEGLHSPKVCARFGGIRIIAEQPASSSDPRSTDHVILRTDEQHNSDYACSYYWRTPTGVAHEAPAYLPPAHYPNSVLVSLCTPLEGSDPSARYRELDHFRTLADPEIAKLIGW